VSSRSVEAVRKLLYLVLLTYLLTYVCLTVIARYVYDKLRFETIATGHDALKDIFHNIDSKYRFHGLRFLCRDNVTKPDCYGAIAD